LILKNHRRHRNLRVPLIPSLPLALLDSFFDGFLNQSVVPAVIKRLLCPDYRFNCGFKLIVTSFTNIPVSHVKIITGRNRILNNAFANIACKGFHIILLIIKLTKFMILRIKKKVERLKMGFEKFRVKDREFGPKKALIIAELGTSHGSDPAKAAELIAAAAEAGADCVKSQIVYAGEILHPNTGEVALPGGNIRLYDRFKQLETGISFFAKMKEETEKRGLLFLCTPFGIKSARELRGLGPEFIKIASPELNYTLLLREIASYGLPMLLSTGVSRLGDIEEAVSLLDEGAQICLLHCVTCYPAPEKDYNLRVLKSLRSVFGCPVGVSDHSMDPELVPVLSVAMGGGVIEKHFCLSRNDPGLDDPIALPPSDFAFMVRAVRRASEMDAEAVQEELSRKRGRELVEAVLGDGVKRLAPPEKANYKRTNRSIHALRDIEQGETIKKDMIASLRTEKNLRPGLPPSWEEAIIGRKAACFIPGGEGIRFEDL
jgi:sialic acid synthase SpsE